MLPLALSLDQVQQWMEVGGYLVLFLVLLGCGLGFPMPEDIPLFLAGFFVAQGKMNLFIAAAAAWCGIIGGDIVLYHLGRKFGPNITRVPLVGRHVTISRLESVEAMFAGYGIWVVAVGRMFAGIRGVMVLAAGTIRYNLITFIIADGIAAIVSGGLFVFLGWLAGRYIGDRSLDQVYRQDVVPYKEWFVLGCAVVAVLLVLYFWWRHKRRKTLAEVALEKAKVIDKPASATPGLESTGN